MSDPALPPPGEPPSPVPEPSVPESVRRVNPQILAERVAHAMRFIAEQHFVPPSEIGKPWDGYDQTITSLIQQFGSNAKTPDEAADEEEVHHFTVAMACAVMREPYPPNLDQEVMAAAMRLRVLQKLATESYEFEETSEETEYEYDRITARDPATGEDARD